MKYFITLLLIFTFVNLKGQTQTTGVIVKSNTVNQRDLTLFDEETTIKTPMADLSNYTNICLSVTGWAAMQNKVDIKKALKQSRFIVEKKPFKKGKTKMNPNTIYFFWNRSADHDNRTTTIIVRDHKMKILYSASHLNTGRAKMLEPILNN